MPTLSDFTNIPLLTSDPFDMAAFSSHTVSSPSVTELASVLPPTLAQTLAEECGLLFLDYNSSGAPPPPSPVIAAHGGLPSHVVVDSGALTLTYVFGAPPFGALADALTDATVIVQDEPMVGVAAALQQYEAAGPSSGPSRRPCENGCPPHPVVSCPSLAAARRSTPYPSGRTSRLSGVQSFLFLIQLLIRLARPHPRLSLAGAARRSPGAGPVAPPARRPRRGRCRGSLDSSSRGAHPIHARP